jgi:sulfur carrier protein
MHITINGEPREMADGFTIENLVTELSINPLHVAVEVNLQLVPRAEHSKHMLKDGDCVEVVTLVGGG